MRGLRLAVLALAGLVLPATSLTQEFTPPEKIIDQMIIALGGQAFLDVDDIKTTGRYFSFKRDQLTGGDVFVDYIKFPDKERTEFGIGVHQLVQINRGDVGWRIPAKKAPLAQTPAETKEFVETFQTSFDYVTRFTLSDRRTTLQNLGTDIVNFKRVDVIEIRDPSKDLIDFYIDRDSHLPARLKVRRNDGPVVYEQLLDNWHKFEGLMVPVTVTHLADGLKTMEIHTETAIFNTDMPDGLFADPRRK